MSSKIKALVIIENNDGSPSVTVYPHTYAGSKDAQKDFIALAKENGIEEDVEFNLDPSNTDAIANVSNPEEGWDLVMIRSETN